MKIEEIIRKEHGSNCIIALEGGADAIIKEYQTLLDSGEYDNDILGREPAQIAAQDAYNQIKQEVLTQWLQRVPRNQMIGMLNAMSQILGGGSIEYLPGESLGPVLAAECWNQANPDADPITINLNYLP